MTTCKQAAEQGFNRLVTLWNNAKPFYASNGGCFWMCGNTLDVALDYLIAARQRDRYNLIEDAFSLFDDKVNDPDPKNWYKEGIWVDDYGWWGIALTKAYMSAEILGYNDSSKNKLAKYATNCWIGMHTAWDPSVVENDDPNVRISGGIWNSRQSDSYLAGRNCVTNEVYRVLCHYLSVAIGPQFMDRNTNEAVWFSQAKTSNVLFDDNKLVLERFKGSPGGVNGYNWLGDQGLFLYGCYRNSDPKAPNLNRTQAQATIQAVSEHKTTNNILSEPLFSDSSFYLDYAGGKGIFMRNLAILNDDGHGSGLGPTSRSMDYGQCIRGVEQPAPKRQLPLFLGKETRRGHQLGVSTGCGGRRATRFRSERAYGMHSLHGESNDSCNRKCGIRGRSLKSQFELEKSSKTVPPSFKKEAGITAPPVPSRLVLRRGTPTGV